jgi:hypothetical protein
MLVVYCQVNQSLYFSAVDLLFRERRSLHVKLLRNTGLDAIFVAPASKHLRLAPTNDLAYFE